jgi:hypothetical protein
MVGDINTYEAPRSHAGATHTTTTTVALPAATQTGGGDAASTADPGESPPAVDTIPPTTDTTAPDPVVTSPVTVSIGDVAIPEGDVGTRVLAFPVTLSRPADTAVSVQFSVTRTTTTSGASPMVASNSSSGSAAIVESDDGSSTTTLKTGTVTFALTSSGLTAIEKKIYLTIQSDTTIEPDQTINVTLSNPSVGATLGRSFATGTVLNDDGITTGITVGVGDVSVVRSQARPILLTMPVWLSAPATDPVSVGFTTNDGTATWSAYAKGGGDYGGAATSGVLDFAPGTIVQYIQLKIWPAASPSPDRSFTISLTSSDSGTTVLRSLGTVTILGN